MFCDYINITYGININIIVIDNGVLNLKSCPTEIQLNRLTNTETKNHLKVILSWALIVLRLWVLGFSYHRHSASYECYTRALPVSV